MQKLSTKNLLWYLLLILPLTFTIGILITEIFVLIIILFFFYQNRNINYFKDKKFLYLLIFSSYIAINAVIKIDHNDLLVSSIFHFRYAIFSLSIFFILNFFKDKISYNRTNFLNVIFFVIFFILFDTFFQFLTGENILGFKIINNRISSIFGSELILGSFLIKILPLILWLFFYLKFDLKNRKPFLICFFSLYFISIYLSGERTSLALMLILIFLTIIFISQLRKTFLVSFAILTLFIILSSSFNIGKSNPFNRIFIKTFNQVTDQLYTEEVKGLSKEELIESRQNILKHIKIFSKNHNGHFILAYDLFSKEPIFGVGPKGFRNYCRSVNYDSEVGMCSTHPHNIFLQILSEMGIIGIIFYLYGILFVVIKAWNIIRKNINSLEKNCFLVVSISLLINLFPFLPSGNFFNNWISIINYYFLGLYLYSYKRVYK